MYQALSTRTLPCSTLAVFVALALLLLSGCGSRSGSPRNLLEEGLILSGTGSVSTQFDFGVGEESAFDITTENPRSTAREQARVSLLRQLLALRLADGRSLRQASKGNPELREFLEDLSQRAPIILDQQSANGMYYATVELVINRDLVGALTRMAGSPPVK